MIVANCILIGIAAGMTRSVFSIAAAAVLIGLTFAAATVFAMNSATLFALGSAIAGFNLGLFGYLVGGVVYTAKISPSAR